MKVTRTELLAKAEDVASNSILFDSFNNFKEVREYYNFLGDLRDELYDILIDSEMLMEEEELEDAVAES